MLSEDEAVWQCSRAVPWLADSVRLFNNANQTLTTETGFRDGACPLKLEGVRLFSSFYFDGIYSCLQAVNGMKGKGCRASAYYEGCNDIVCLLSLERPFIPWFFHSSPHLGGIREHQGTTTQSPDWCGGIWTAICSLTVLIYKLQDVTWPWVMLRSHRGPGFGCWEWLLLWMPILGCQWVWCVRIILQEIQ